MRVTFERTERAGGFLWLQKKYAVKLTIVFSEEEKAIIKSRSLARTPNAYWIWEGTKGGAPQGVSLQRMVNEGSYIWPADSMAEAEGWEAEVREALPRLKALLDVSGQPANKTDTFEL